MRTTFKSGTVNGYYFNVTQAEFQTRRAIDGGRIIKLHIVRGGVEYAHYNEGWEQLPASDEVKAVYEEITSKYN